MLNVNLNLNSKSFPKETQFIINLKSCSINFFQAYCSLINLFAQFLIDFLLLEACISLKAEEQTLFLRPVSLLQI